MNSFQRAHSLIQQLEDIFELNDIDKNNLSLIRTRLKSLIQKVSPEGQSAAESDLEYAGLPNLDFEDILEDCRRITMKIREWVESQLDGKDRFSITQQKFCRIFETDQGAESYLKLHLDPDDMTSFTYSFSGYELDGMPELTFERK